MYSMHYEAKSLAEACRKETGWEAEEESKESSKVLGI